MLLWVVIYSYLPANNFFSSTGSFVDEVEVLFSNVTFWATVVFSVLVALGKWNIEVRLDHVSLTSSSAPRFIYKFASSAYAPLDKEIIREMWVSGDLKDRLGIRHRKASKNIHTSDLETAPMFREPHARSTSEIALPAYEPTRASPESDVSEKRPTGYTNYSLEVDQTMQPPFIQVGSSEIVDMQTEQALVATVSPHASYYSSNDIPIPSPIPPSLFCFPDGQIGEKPSRGSSPTSIPPVPGPSHTRSPSSMGLSSPESFEMQVRRPAPDTRSRSQGFRTYPSEAAFQSTYVATGSGGFHLDETSPRPESVQSWTGGQAL